VLESNGLHTRFFCEEFAFEPFSENGHVKTPALAVSTPNEQVIGLCSTCDHLGNCALVSTESVILTCELYQ
jgi:hypothetical protein